MSQQTKADREAAGKKAAATRQRNEARADASAGGKKAGATRHANNATKSLREARRAAHSAVSEARNVAGSVGEAAVHASRSVVSRVGAVARR